ncbi:CheR family methyltransferase [Vreelandella malpeensis]|uniref:Protein-glutamate O-methyltransferase CheR n=1 Tax=Vreelandella malpeensis TaxID=1172368 RepID=A0ABS8DQ29_9GAMM|nr:protein-glutamate O-methyltransferase CheR [Halomonas malpeensis]MCB8888255.1 protein-glutamate O-methyltransferase CheR [Halomonas malpeensis]
MKSYAPFKQLIYERYGLDLEGLAEPRLVRAVDALLDATGTRDPGVLVKRLRRDAALLDDFISQLTINETYFYREPEALAWLAEHYLPERLARGAGPLRILSAGCSSGEEPYSLGMALLERFGARAPTLFRIIGGDVDHRVLAKARRGIYAGMAFRALPGALKTRYFTPRGHQFAIDNTLRDWVRFQALNVLEPSGDSEDGGPFDLILFRNVSIYFDEQKRIAIQKRLLERLAPEGILVCGVSETLGNDLGVLELTQREGVFHFRRPTHQAAASRPLPAPASTAMPKPECIAAPVRAATPLPAVMPAAAESFAQRVQEAQAHLNDNRFDDAEALLATLLDEQPWSVDARLLAGLVARWQQRPEQAQKHFKRALYVAPECWPAHFYQAELVRAGELEGIPGQPMRGYAAVLRLLEASPHATGGLTIIASPIPPGDARFLAKRHLVTGAQTREADDGL